jgi:hypothetical protein
MVKIFAKENKKNQHAECNIVRELFVCQLHLYIVALGCMLSPL